MGLSEPDVVARRGADASDGPRLCATRSSARRAWKICGYRTGVRRARLSDSGRSCWAGRCLWVGSVDIGGHPRWSSPRISGGRVGKRADLRAWSIETARDIKGGPRRVRPRIQDVMKGWRKKMGRTARPSVFLSAGHGVATCADRHGAPRLSAARLHLINRYDAHFWLRRNGQATSSSSEP